jgi:branched-chain amino acid transport system ATP-binding protein
MLEVKDLQVAYDDVTVVRHLSIKVEKGSIVALLGANAAGKTTLISAVSGIIPSRKGEIWFKESRIDNTPAFQIVKKGLITVPEGRHLFPKLTVQDNLELGAYSTRARGAMRASIENVYSYFPKLSDRRTQLAGSLSGGEAQMCAIGRGLMGLPELLILDEPSLGLSPDMVDFMFETILRLREKGTTILLVEQNVRQSLELCDHAYVMEDGRIAMSGEGKALLHDDGVRKAYLGV